MSTPAKSGQAILPTSIEGAAILVLWRSHLFDSADIARLLSLPESNVLRIIGLGRALGGKGGPA